MLAMYLAVLDDRSSEEQFIDVSVIDFFEEYTQFLKSQENIE